MAGDPWEFVSKLQKMGGEMKSHPKLKKRENSTVNFFLINRSDSNQSQLKKQHANK